MEDLLQVSDVQHYHLNGHFAVFLKKRPMAGRGRAGEVRCEECERTLLDAAYRFCSIGCKVRSICICIYCFIYMSSFVRATIIHSHSAWAVAYLMDYIIPLSNASGVVQYIVSFFSI